MHRHTVVEVMQVMPSQRSVKSTPFQMSFAMAKLFREQNVRLRIIYGGRICVRNPCKRNILLSGRECA
jgi:hypothetical protein